MAHVGVIRNNYRVRQGNVNERENWVEISTDGRIFLKWVLKNMWENEHQFQSFVIGISER